MRFTIPQLKLSVRLILLIVIIIVLAVLPVIGLPQQWLIYIRLFCIYLAIANMWNLLCGYSGLISLCQPAFIGLAGYTMIMLAWVGIPIYVGIIAGAIVAAIFALLISVPVFRLRGIYFAIGTLVVPEALKYVFLLWKPVGGKLQGGGAGYVLKGAGEFSTAEVYWLALVIGMASIFLMWFILRSKLGLGLAAIRDNDTTAASSGINVFRLKLFSFIIGAIVTGIAGAIFYISQAAIEPTSAFNIKWTMICILAAVIGGLRSQAGPIIGTLIVVFLHFALARYAGYSLLIQGIILVGVMLVAPHGIMGAVLKSRPYRSLVQLASRH
jgi:branched-chain amino acid transport system permease protein